MKQLFKLLAPAPYCEPIADESEIGSTYWKLRVQIFYSMFIGYIFYYFSRKSFTFAMPALIEDLGYDKAQLGILASIFSIAYGSSKFFVGILGDRSNPRYFMALGLIFTGIVNIFFGLSSSLFMFAFCWGLNGIFQGFGWPPCAKLLTHWYSPNERGRWWSFWNTSHNIGGAIIPLIATACAYNFGWRYAMYVPGLLCIGCGFFLMNRLRDIPQSIGLPNIEDFRHDHGIRKEKDGELSIKELLLKYVITNKFVWLLAFGYFFIYFIRLAISDWTTVFLVETQGYSHVKAGGVVSWFEMGGLVGTLAAGFASDKIFKSNRGPINVFFSAATAFALYMFWRFSGISIFFDSVLVFFVGFLVFGPQMLIGMAAAELSHKKAVGAATGFVGFFAYLGAACAGYPLGQIAHSFGWDGYFFAIIVSAIAACLVLLPTMMIRPPRPTHKFAIPAKAGTAKVTP